MDEYIKLCDARDVFCEYCDWIGTDKCEHCKHPMDEIKRYIVEVGACMREES